MRTLYRLTGAVRYLPRAALAWNEVSRRAHFDYQEIWMSPTEHESLEFREEARVAASVRGWGITYLNAAWQFVADGLPPDDPFLKDPVMRVGGAIFMSAAAAEAILNECLIYLVESKHLTDNDGTKLVEDRNGAPERCKKMLKLLFPGEDLCGVPEFQSLRAAMEIRNLLIHYDPKAEVLDKLPSRLEKYRRLLPVLPTGGLHWTSVMFSDDIGQWVVRTVHEWALWLEEILAKRLPSFRWASDWARFRELPRAEIRGPK
jgi:hypothetical protein